ncbi:MAG: nucleotide exchange factor GrpE [Candidatus Saganbacteria bacterium]|nr:nucleotide exchange factor GrpE [Candidatus Saganbacteria bacterium]
MEKHKNLSSEARRAKEEKVETKELNLEELKKMVEPIIHNKNQEHQNTLLRTLADFENYKKRVQNEKESLVKFSNQMLICDLLPVLDNFERALVETEKQGGHEEIIKGLSLIKKQMEDIFTKFGVKKVEALGKPFDPHFHQAVQKVESDKPENQIVEEMQKGYILNGRLIRPAMVIISKGGK